MSIVILLLFLIWPLDQKYVFANENWVEVEQLPYEMEDNGKEKKVKFFDYKERRQDWNFRFTFLGVRPEINNYTLSTTEFIPGLKPNGTGFEGLISISYNIGIISTGIDFGVLSAGFNRGVSVLLPKASLHIMADAILNNPYFVPFVKIGGSKMEFDNGANSDLPNLKSNLAVFYSLGGMFSLDWFQKTLAMDAYFGYGLEATYLIFEYETFSSIPMEVSGLPDVKLKSLKFGLQLAF